MTVAAHAAEAQVVGPRALAMGGVGVACSEDYVAQYYNPAAFGFFGQKNPDGSRSPSDNADLERKDWGVGLDALASYTITPSLGTYLNTVLQADVSKLNTLGQAGANDAQILADAVKVLAAVSEFNPQQDYLVAEANAGMGIRIGHFGLGTRFSASASGTITDLDTSHLGISLTGFASVAEALSNIQTNLAPGYMPQTLTAAQVQQLTTTLGTDKNGNPVAPAEVTAAINNIDSALTTAGLSGAAVQGVVDQFGNVVSGSAANRLLTDNTTKLQLMGIALAEVPVTYGVAFDEHWSIGGSVKYMVGRVYGSQISLLNVKNEDVAQALRDARQDYAQSSNIGVDLGIEAHFPLVQLGLTGRNLNGPNFAGPTVQGVKFHDINVDPSVTAGVAFIPFTTVTLAADVDLTQDTTVDNFQKYQHAGLGFEWNALHVLALRAGLSKNIAESQSNYLYSAGLGLNLYLLRIDLAAQMSTETVDYDGSKYPENGAVSLAIATDW